MAFRFDKFTLKAQEAVQRAQDLAADRGNPQIDPLHLLAALLAEDEGVVRPILDKIGVNRAQLDRIVEAELGHFPKGSGGGPPQPSQSLIQVFEAAQREAGTMKDDFVSTEHLLLALAKADSKAKSMLKLNAIGEKRAAGSDAHRPRQPARHRSEPGSEVPGAGKIRHRPGRARQARQARPGDRPRPGNPPRHPGALAPHEEQSGADRRAGRRQDGHRRRACPADRARRRAAEPEEQARDRARPGRADRRARSTAASSRTARRPSSAKSKPPPATSFCSSTSCTRSSAQVPPKGAADAANLLKPALARGELRCIGATTLDEYRKHIEKDAALERRFQPIYVGEPTRRRHDRHSPRPQAALRSASQRREDQGLGPGRRGPAFAPLHHRSLSARQGDRPGRRGHEPAGDGAGERAQRDRRGAAADHAA